MAYLGFVPPGVVLPFAGATPPQGWLLCDGTAYSRTTYAALFAVIGTTYDTQFNEVAGGNHSAPAGTDFRVPDYRASFLRGVGQASGKDNTTLGGRQAEKTAKNGLALSANAAPDAHSHGSSNMAAGIGFANFGGGAWFIHMKTRNTYSSYSQTNSRAVGNVPPSNVTDPDTGSGAQATTAVFGSTDNNSGSAVSLGAGDNETRPMNKGVNYIIKI